MSRRPAGHGAPTIDATPATASAPLVFRSAEGWVVLEPPDEAMRLAVFRGPGAEERARRYAAWLLENLT